MTVYLVSLVIVAVMSGLLFMWSMETDSLGGIIGFIAGLLGALASLVGGVALMVMAFGWNAAEHQARIINREYGTNYTQAEVFYASSVIDTVRELQRRRVEVNGDVFRDQADPSVQARREKAK